MASVEEESQLESIPHDDEDNDEEEDDILKPVFTKKSSSPLSKGSVFASSPLISPTSTADATQESIEERARAAAQCNLKYQRSDYTGLSLSDFYWNVHSNKNDECYSYPCHVVSPNDVQSYGDKPRKGQVAIRYIGSSEFFRPPNYKPSFAIVLRKQLMPYNQTTATTADKGDDSMIITHESSPIPKWCPQRMQQMRDLLLQNSHDETIATNRQNEFLKESIYLDCVLELVSQLQEEEAGHLVSQEVTMESEEDSTSGSEEEDAEKQRRDIVEEDGSKTALPERQGPTKSSAAAAVLPPQSTSRKRVTIRAGDVIMYSPPEATFEACSWRTSTIKNVWGNSQCLALLLFNGRSLPRDCRIVVLRRFLRNKLQEATKEPHVWRNLTDCALVKGEIDYDPANPNAPTMQDKIARIMEEGRQEVRNWNPDDDVSVRSSGNTGVTAAVAPTKTLVTPRTKAATQRRTVSLGAHTAHKRQQKRRSPKPLAGKRKANAVQQESSPVETSSQGEPKWRKELEAQLEDCAQERKKRRVDYDGVQVRERSLKMAIRVRMLDKWNDAMVNHLANDWELQASTLHTYLDGNPKNMLFKDTVRELNEKFEGYLAR